VRFGKEVAQKAKARQLRRPAGIACDNVEQLLLEQITGLGPVYPNRPRQWMGRAQISSGDIRNPAARRDLAIERVQRIEDGFVARTES
jgi:hypothetical protein